jgi:hypothetical protein
VLQSIRDDGDGESIAPDIIDRQTDSIDSNGAFPHQQWSHRSRDGEANDGKLAFCAHRYDLCDAVYVSSDEMAAETISKTHGTLEIDGAAQRQFLQARPLQSFRRNVYGEGLGRFSHNRQTGTIHSDARAVRHPAHRQFGCHRQHSRITFNPQRCDFADVFD